jgi:hypothetical protein
MTHPKKFQDTTEPLAFTITKEIVEEAIRLGLNGHQMMGLAILRSHGHANAPAVKVGKSGSAKFTNGVIEIGGRAPW